MTLLSKIGLALVVLVGVDVAITVGVLVQHGVSARDIGLHSFVQRLFTPDRLKTGRTASGAPDGSGRAPQQPSLGRSPQ